MFNNYKVITVKIFIPTDPKMFQKNCTKSLKNVRIAKLMLRIIFFNFLDVLNFIICMFSGTVTCNDIQPQ